MTTNQKKTKEMQLGPITKCNSFIALHIGNVNVEQVKSFKLLRIYINDKLTWNSVVEYNI